MTSPWVSIFSRFTSEALLFESLIIFSLAALYTGFWLVRKRKFGVIEKQVPAGVVKYYLNELIVDAEVLRAQLFGMLTGHGVPATPLAGVHFSGVSIPQSAPAESHPAPAAHTSDPAAAQALSALEAKLADQAKQIESFTNEKLRIEKELLAAKTASQTAGASGTNNAADLAKLQEKIAILEGKLAEYSVIEDDLANLKRLQQENAALKAQLANRGGATPSPQVAQPATAPSRAPAPVIDPEPPVPDPQEAVDSVIQSIEPVVAAAAEETPVASPEPVAAAAAQTPGAPDLANPVASAEAGTLEGGFEGLVDQVEQSLQPTAEETAAAAPPAPEADSTTAPVNATIEKSDADLVSEFEKMLNG